MKRTPAKPHERIVGLYEDHAEAWAALRSGSDVPERAWLDRFAALLDAGADILDVGCGSGVPMARELIGQGFGVTGIDSSPSLIALCRERFPEHRWIAADMRRLDLGRAFDGVVAWHSLFHLTPDDQRVTLPRLAAHCRPGGVLMLTTGDGAGVRIGEWQGEPLYHASLDADEYEEILETSGFAVLERRLRDPASGEATVWLARRSHPV